MSMMSIILTAGISRNSVGTYSRNDNYSQQRRSIFAKPNLNVVYNYN